MDVILAIFIPVPFTFLLLSLLSLAYFRLCTIHTTPEDVEVSRQKKPSPRRFKSSEVDALSSNFASSPVIGVGGFSTVYLTSLRELPSSTSVAVKVHNLSQCLHRAFRQELDILLRVDHPHIVRLLGYCDDKDKGILVFEFVPNGTLSDILHASSDSSSALSWSHRVFILFRIATALEYLHEGCGLPIVHGDVKSSNVLLSDVLEPKLCDFGFARMGFKAAVTRSAHQIIGSLGYVDPHYLRTGLVLKKSDVYSFGVLILEMVTGMEAFDPEKEQLLTTVVGLVGVVGELIDPKLGKEFDADEASVLIEIATRCIAEQPVLRPSMGDVIKMMKEKVCLVSHTGKLHM